MKSYIYAIAILLISVVTFSSCSSQDEAVSSNDKYMELYQTTYENLRNAFSNTRSAESYGNEVTEEEIAGINSFGILVSYDQARLLEIEASDVYKEMKLEGEQRLEEAKSRFLQTHILADYGKIVTFTERYIKAGTHNHALLEQSIEGIRDEEVKKYMALSAAVVDAYGEEEVWVETFKIATLTPCDEAAIVKVSLVLVGVALDLTIDAAIPWSALLTMANTIKNICSLITIHNEWVACTKRLNNQG